MATEIEKKYRVTEGEVARLRVTLSELGARDEGEVFESNTVYAGNNLGVGSRALRLRREGGRTLLTLKERPDSEPEAVKRRHEIETEVSDADAVAAILDALGYRPALVYEKRRETWHAAGAEIVLDELPFGTFVEIEGEEESILKAEELLGLSSAEAEHASYPELTARLGKNNGGVFEARFDE